MYPDLVLGAVVQVVRHPSEPYLYVVEQTGKVRRFRDTPDASTTEVALDLGDVVHMPGGEDGLLGLAFDPGFATNGDAVVKYTAVAPGAEEGVRTVVARVHSDDGGATFVRASLEEILHVDRPQVIHHGGSPVFGPDGLLYVPIGDGGWEPERRAQDLSIIEGKILRIDTTVKPYRIPEDNPFVGTAGARREIFARGLRNPFGRSFDPETGAFWVGDVGLSTYEEIDRITAGSNYGWPLREGPICSPYASPDCSAEGLTDPVYTYRNTGGSAVVVGPVYHGTAIPSARGHLVFGDFVTGRIEHLEQERPGEGPAVAKLLVESGINISSMTEAADGELLVVDYNARIWRLEPAENVRAVPSSLADSGCVDMSRPLVVPDGLVPYEVNMPLWSDGADKSRWMALPEGKNIHVLDDGSWEFPVGAVLVKTFATAGLPIETRLLVRHDDGEWAGYSYAWNEAGTEATLLEGGEPRVVHGVAWTYPSRGQCMACHTSVAGRSLGLETAQLNREARYPNGVVANQLAAMEHAELFDRPLGDPASLARFPARDYVMAESDDWARAYLHANCSHCHRPGGPGRGTANLMASALLSEAGCGVTPELDTLGIWDAQVIAPSNPELSVLLLRMGRTDGARMPPLGTSQPDTLAIDHLRSWITQTSACD